MTKIYKRKMLIADTKPQKDEKKRKRNAILNFRISPEEKRLIEDRIELSGLLRQDYFIQSCLHQKVVTYGNVKTFDIISKKLEIVDKHLTDIMKAEYLDLEVLESLRMILEMLEGLENNR